jgi:hypothetical protein
MTTLPEQQIDRLRAAGLVVSEPFSSEHQAYPNGLLVAKPVSVSGNSIPGYDSSFGFEPNVVAVDAPVVKIFANNDKWFVESYDCVPAPGPGDFLDEWNTLEEAIADILDLYFGDPSRMTAKACHNG